MYKYDIPGKDAIQKTGLHNYSTNVDYDDMLIYSVSLEKLSESSRIELDRALKLLSSLDMAPYLNDESTLIRSVADMLCDYDKSERAQMERDTRNKQELEYYTKLNASIKEAKEEGIAIGEEKGIAIAKAEAIRNLAKRGMKSKEISEILNYELSYVEEVLKK